jgi:predicted SAM-dependent methyltransferase
VTPARESLKRVRGLVPIVRAAREKRISARRRVQDARFFASRTQRAKRIETYLQTHAVRKLQLGTGNNLYSGWLNTDIADYKRESEVVYLDARKPFPLPDASFDFVFSEHMIEHLTYIEGVHCLTECHRVLRPEGRIRVATPSLDRLMQLYDPELTDLQRRYIRWSTDTFIPHADEYLPGFVVNNFFRDWGHQFIYDSQTLRHALLSVGFVDVEERPVGLSDSPELVGVERHMRLAAEFNEYETMVLEARKP